MGPAAPTVLAVDPGSDKCGLAVVTADGAVAWREIVATADLSTAVARLVQEHGPDRVLMGNGTWSKKLRPVLVETLARSAGPTLVMVDEKHTTERARILYWEHNPPKGLWRLVPLGLQVPREPYDDYAAVVMARDFLARADSAALPPGRQPSPGVSSRSGPTGEGPAGSR